MDLKMADTAKSWLVIQDGAEFYEMAGGECSFLWRATAQIRDDHDMAGALRARAEFLDYAAAHGATVTWAE